MKLDPMVESTLLEDLVPSMQDRVGRVLQACNLSGINMRLATTLRGPGAQAMMWCRARSPEEIRGMAAAFRKRAPRIASLFNEEWAGISHQTIVDLPGFSWHQHGLAADFYVCIDGTATWKGSLVEDAAVVARRFGLYNSLDQVSWKKRPYHIGASKYEHFTMDRTLGGSLTETEEAMCKVFDI